MPVLQERSCDFAMSFQAHWWFMTHESQRSYGDALCLLCLQLITRVERQSIAYGLARKASSQPRKGTGGRVRCASQLCRLASMEV